jgi:mono/diheme cytochrome c family protein
MIPPSLILAVALAVACAAPAFAKDMKLPPDGVQLRPSPLPGFALARGRCVACHSAEYMQYQPPNAARPYWEAVVRRMKDVFKAPIADAEVAPLADYLASAYGVAPDP